jgi:hypothetical protein
MNITVFEIKQDASAKNISPYALIKRDILLEFTSNTWGLADVSISIVLDKVETTPWYFAKGHGKITRPRGKRGRKKNPREKEILELRRHLVA